MGDVLHDDRAIIPGSYDPVTRGHLDVIRRASPLFRSLHVAVLDNPEKRASLSVEERLDLLRGELAGLEGVQVASFTGLAVTFAARVGARWIVRGVRSAADVTYELPMALSNRRCGAEDIETLLLPTSNDVSFISSRLVRQIAAHGGELAPFVTERVERVLRARLGPRTGRRGT